MAVGFSKAQKYLSNSAIYAPQIINEYIAYRGSITPQGSAIPNTATSDGYNIISDHGINVPNYVLRNDTDVPFNLYMPQLIADGYQYNFEQEIFLSNTIVFNYKTTTLASFTSSSSTGNAYRLRKSAYDNSGDFYPWLVVEKIGKYSDIYEKYKNYSVLTDIQAFVDTGEPERPLYGTINQSGQAFTIWSVSSYYGTEYYDRNNKYIRSTPKPINAKLLINQSRFLFSTDTTYGSGREKDFVWFDLLTKAGADIVIFSTNDNDRTGDPVNFGKTAIMFPEPKDFKKLGNSLTVPFVVDHEELAKTGDIKNFPLYEPPGVPENDTGGGEGNGDNESDKVDEAKNPDLSPIAAGNNLYAMTQTELEQTFDFLWDGHNKDILGCTI